MSTRFQPPPHLCVRAPLRAAALLLTLAVLAAGCSAAVPEASARVVLTEMAIALPRDHAIGTAVWDVANTGAAHHSLTVCAGDLGRCVAEPVPLHVLRKPADARDPDSLPDETIALVLGSGWQSTVQLELQPGRYRLYCGVPNHAERGMQTVIRVR